jgi:hypothetical protein
VSVQFQLTVDCADPDRLARFWAEVLGYVPEPPPLGHSSWREYYAALGVDDDVDGVDSLVDPDGAGPRIWFQKVPESKSAKNRLHLDVAAGVSRDAPLEERARAIRAVADRLVAIGATVVREVDGEGIDFFGVTLLDPEGNEFCVH